MRRSNRARSGKKRNRSSSKANKRVKVSNNKKVADLAWNDAEITSEEETDPKVCLNSPYISKLCDLFTRDNRAHMTIIRITRKVFGLCHILMNT